MFEIKVRLNDTMLCAEFLNCNHMFYQMYKILKIFSCTPLLARRQQSDLRTKREVRNGDLNKQIKKLSSRTQPFGV